MADKHVPDTLDEETRQPRPRRAGSGASQVHVPALTLACHPLMRRVGERALLPRLLMGETCELSRVAPVFASPEGVETDVLRDPYISRRAVELSARGERLVIANVGGVDLRLDGRPVTDRVSLPMALLNPGLALELSGRVLLWLHTFPLDDGTPRPQTFDLVGESAALTTLLKTIAHWGPTELPVLLRGESGTGKELIARALHAVSERSKGPYVPVNMAAIPTTTAPAELFGHAAGAFSGAMGEHRGFFGRADGGTLFLDEIGACPDAVQPMLLRALETGEVQQVGSRGTFEANVRLIAATDADLEAEVEQGRFRLALLHRLQSAQIRVPPLRERPDDVPRLIVHFLEQALADPSPLDAPDPSGDPWFPPALMARLIRYAWPGNVRQLRNAARVLAAESAISGGIDMTPNLESLLPDVAPDPAGDFDLAEDQINQPEANPVAATPTPKARVRLADITDQEVFDALKANAWRIHATARDLGVSKSSLYVLMDRSALIRKAKDLEQDEIEAARDKVGADLSAMSRELQVSRRGLQLRMTELAIDLDA